MDECKPDTDLRRRPAIKKGLQTHIRLMQFIFPVLHRILTNAVGDLLHRQQLDTLTLTHRSHGKILHIHHVRLRDHLGHKRIAGVTHM